MLTRPLAYKGPNDHLSQLFRLDSLFRGFQMIKNDSLMDWQFLKEESLVKGVFFDNQKIIKTSLIWPLVKGHPENDCNCMVQIMSKQGDEVDCDHLAALAIEAKVQLDRLPSPIKQADGFSSEVAYFQNWLANQAFDPFPNMARHRVVYIIAPKNDKFAVSIHKAYLTQQDEYQLKAPLKIDTNVADKLPKFVSLTDQQILVQLQKLVAANPQALSDTNEFLLEGNEFFDLLAQIVESGRSFWRSCHRKPLALDVAFQVADDWLKLGEQIYLSRSLGKLLKLNNYNQKQLWLLKALNRTDFDVESLTATLTVDSHHISLNWGNGQVFDFDSASVSFSLDEQVFQFEEIKQILESVEDRNSRALYEKIASYLHQIHWLPSIKANFEPPISSRFDSTTRILEGDLAHWFPLLSGLLKEGWTVNFSDNFRLNQTRVDDWYSRVTTLDKQAATGLRDEPQDWFELEVGVKVDGEAVNILPYIVEGLKQGALNLTSENEFIPMTLSDGKIVTVEKKRVLAIVGTLMELAESKPLTDQKLRLPTSQLTRLKNVEESLEQKLDWRAAKKLKSKARQLAKSDGVSAPEIPVNVKAKLRDYQKLGVGWLQFLRQQEIGGILADDMGLGKTLQTLTHIQISKNEGLLKGPCLIVAPTSLLGNWAAEAKKFTPELKLINWAGTRRHSNFEQLKSNDIVVTSYGLLLRDAEKLNQLSLDTIILDEAQAIKNSRAKISKIAFSMRSNHRLCLTGTPLENHLGELWSLFHFLMPGLLGDQTQFKRLFQLPIEKDQDWQRKQQLAERVAPFMLRRTKEKVASDLPAKTEIAEFVELTEPQADLYETVRMSMLDEVQKALHDNSGGANHLLIGNALLRLRQISCHPALVNFGKEQEAESAKVIWLRAVLPELVESGSRVLIFSSFTSMLSILEEELKQLRVEYLTLTGKTRNRTELVEKFQTGKVPVFLISLKAGGAGLNLTKADTVIHFDPWWNPAAEEQASDRAHRIGQDKPVFVYKLIAKGTVEERIFQMQQQKSQLAEDLYRQNDFFQQLTRPDWETLLAPLDD